MTCDFLLSLFRSKTENEVIDVNLFHKPEQINSGLLFYFKRKTNVNKKNT